MKRSANHLHKQISKTVELDYFLFTPDGYEREAGSPRPLVVFLHGAGERGNDLEKVTVTAIDEIVSHQDRLGFLLLAPQCPLDTWWPEQIDALNELLDATIATHAVDTARIYLTGLSMGGGGTWFWAAVRPDTFAAIAPICGAPLWWQGFPERARALKDVPVWAFHGEADKTVPVEVTRKIVALLEALKADVKLTVYPGVDHDSWTQTYRSPDLFEWMLGQKL